MGINSTQAFNKSPYEEYKTILRSIIIYLNLTLAQGSVTGNKDYLSINNGK